MSSLPYVLSVCAKRQVDGCEDKLLGFEGELVSALKPLRKEFSDAVDAWVQRSRKGGEK